MNWRRYLDLIRQSANAWIEDRAASMGAALAYYTVFSIAPLLLIVISVAGLVFGREAAQGAVVAQAGSLVGESSARTIQDLLVSVSEPGKGIIGTVVGLVLLVVGATTVFAELQDDLNRIWKVDPKAQAAGLWGWLRARVLSIGMIMAIGFLMLVSLAASAAISAFGTWSTSWLSQWAWLGQLVNFVFSFGMVTVLFAMIYRFMPQIRIRWRDVWLGAAVTAALFTIGKWLIGLYIGKSAVASGFGAAGSLAVLLVWVYYSAQVFLFGAEYTSVYAHLHGSLKDRQPAATPAGATGIPVAQLPGKDAAGSRPLAPARRRAKPATAGARVLQAVRRNPVAGLLGSALAGAVAVRVADALSRVGVLHPRR